MSHNRVARHYQGPGGQEYFAYQFAISASFAKFEARKFACYIKATDTVVDFGCGAGLVLKSLDATTKLGVEVNPTARSEAERHGTDTVSSVNEIADHYADVVISNHALEHTIRPIDELEAIRRILKPNGRLVICLPFDDWRMNRRFRVDMDEPNHHLYTWSPLLLRNMLLEAGYAVAESRLVRFTWPPFTVQVGKLPRNAFLAAGAVASFLRQKREVIAVASPDLEAKAPESDTMVVDSLAPNS
jgi:SAM-dependent methyltransferase